MRLLVYADLHAGMGSENCFNQAASLQLCRVEKFFDDALQVYKQYQCEAVIDLGDTTNDRSSVPIPVIDLVTSKLKQFPESPFNVKLIGNHEQYVKSGKVHTGGLFDRQFSVIADTGLMEIDNMLALFCSYPESHEILAQQIIQTVRDCKGRRLALFGHFQVVGASMNSGEALTGCPKSALKGFELGLLGHVHAPQVVTENVHYVGSPFQQNYGEAGEAKRVAIVDTETFAVNWVTLGGFPSYYRVALADFEKTVQETSEDRFQVTLNNHQETERFFKHPLFHRAQAVYSYDVAQSQAAQPGTTDWTFEGILRRYLKKCPPEAELSAEEMLSVGLEIAQGQT